MKYQNEKTLIKWQNRKLYHNNCLIPDLVWAFSYVEMMD